MPVSNRILNSCCVRRKQSRVRSAPLLLLAVAVTANCTPIVPRVREIPFSPSHNKLARELVYGRGVVVHEMNGIDAALLTAFHRKVPKTTIAVGKEPFAITDASEGVPRRFDFAYRTDGVCFILYEVGGRAYHSALLVFRRRGAEWEAAAAATGFLRNPDVRSLKIAVKRGEFRQEVDDYNL